MEEAAKKDTPVDKIIEFIDNLPWIDKSTMTDIIKHQAIKIKSEWKAQQAKQPVMQEDKFLDWMDNVMAFTKNNIFSSTIALDEIQVTLMEQIKAKYIELNRMA